MKAYKAKTSQHEVTGTDGNTILFGINIFGYEWVNTGSKSIKMSGLKSIRPSAKGGVRPFADAGRAS